MPFPLQVDQSTGRRKPSGSEYVNSHPVQRTMYRGLRPLRSAEGVCRRVPGNSANSPGFASPEASLLPLALPYRSAVVIADFIATGDTFHRRLAKLARTVAARICLVQHPGPAGGEQDNCTTEILLEGLRHRLGLDPAHCTVLADATQLNHFVRPDGRDLFVLGASQSADGARRLTPAASEHGLDCDVMLVEDQSDWD